MLHTLWLLSLVVGAFAAPSQHGAYKVKEKVAHPSNWARHSDPPSSHTITLRFGLPQANFDLLVQHLNEISHPDNPRYGEHLSKEEVEALVAPPPESLDAVTKWLVSHGFSEDTISYSAAKDWLTVNASVAQAEKMLNTKYHVWQHDKSGDYMVRTTSYSLPEELHDHIEVVQPTTMFARFDALAPRITGKEEASPDSSVSGTLHARAVDASCNTTITVKCLKQIYNINNYAASTSVNNSIGVTGYVGQFATYEDQRLFYLDQVPGALTGYFTYLTVNGGVNNQAPQTSGYEANLDTQFAFGVAYPVPGTFYSTGGTPPYIPDKLTPTNTNEPFQAWLDYVTAQASVPLVISTSYADSEQTVPLSYATRLCSGFAQLGARGVSLLFGSGDWGVGGNPSGGSTAQYCVTNDGRNATTFIPLFPASCPYVTTVGAVTSIPEVAVTRFYSGGGFSNYFAQPSYQSSAVATYLSNQLPAGTYAGLFNASGRAYPDVAFQGDKYRIFVNGSSYQIGGTSAATPGFSGLVALLNDARIRAGKKSLGFLNPFLYSTGLAALNDITVGNNPGCGTPGFNASTGWDPVTGLGTPNFSALLPLATKA